MLLFIKELENMELGLSEFQYISCYCLSLQHLCTSSSFSYFNTSHVTVYPSSSLCSIQLTLFQYISCYCLSIAVKTKESVLVIFQYISCYCLSHLWQLHLLVWLDFNTSHVTVYQAMSEREFVVIKFQYISCYCLSGAAWYTDSDKSISIHLMLLFI